MKSAWERLTNGRCNNDEDVLARPKAKTAREIKRELDAQRTAEKALKKFERAASMQGKDLRKLSDSWVKRLNRNPGDFHKAQPAGAVRYLTAA